MSTHQTTTASIPVTPMRVSASRIETGDLIDWHGQLVTRTRQAPRLTVEYGKKVDILEVVDPDGTVRDIAVTGDRRVRFDILRPVFTR